MLETIDTLITDFRRFDWISAISRKGLTLLERALRHFEVLKFLWQLSTTSQDHSSEKKDPFTHKLVLSALQKSSVNLSNGKVAKLPKVKLDFARHSFCFYFLLY